MSEPEGAADFRQKLHCGPPRTSTLRGARKKEKCWMPENPPDGVVRLVWFSPN
jgi:hypothetical protein